MTEYEPGTVAVATVRGVPNVRVMKSHRPSAPVHEWFSDRAIDARYGHPSTEVTNVRPLVVLDRSDPLTTARYLEHAADGKLSLAATIELKAMAAQIRAQTRPPKPAEPTGLGAVVEDAKGVRWVRIGEMGHAGADDWKYSGTLRTTHNDWTTYADIDAVKVLSEGVQQ